jgi:hypothetical protein
MSPEGYISLNGKIIDQQMDEVTKSFLVSKKVVEAKIIELIDKLELDESGNVVDNAANKAILNRCLLIVRGQLKKNKAQIIAAFKSGSKLIDGNAENYLLNG